MPRYSIFLIFLFVSCAQAFMEETQDVIIIPISASYDVSSSGVLVEWETQWDFNKTEIHRGLSPNDLDLYIDDSPNSSIVDSSVAPGKEHYYQVVAYNSKGRTIGQSSVATGYRSYNSIDSVVVPSNLQADSYLSADSIKFFWSGSVSDTYRIHRKKLSSAETDFEFHEEVNFGSNEELMYVDYDVELGEVVCYTVSVVGQDSDKQISEKFSIETVQSTTKEAPSGVVASEGDASIAGSIKITWDYKQGDEYYSVYRATSEYGTYYQIAPLVLDNSYIDKSLPYTTGEWVDGVYTYPKYYYKVTSGTDSGYSAAAVGYTLDKSDVLSYPNDFTAQFNTSDFTLNLSWLEPNGASSKNYEYKLIKIDVNNNTNVLLQNSQLTSFTINMSPENASTYSYYGEYYTYEIVAINTDVDIAGVASSVSYTHSLPGAVTISKISTNEMSITTNYETKEDTVSVYYKSGSSTVSSNVGWVTEEWTTSITGGHIDLEWTPFHKLEEIAYYTIYRKLKNSSDDFEVIATDIKDTQFRDDNFTPEQLSQGSEYQYKVIATDFLSQSGLEGNTTVGRVLAPADILPAPSYLTVPAHWARKKAGKGGAMSRYTRYSEIGFGSSGYTWTTGANSPQGADKISGLAQSGQHLYLVWDDVPNATSYNAKVNGNNISGTASFRDSFAIVENFGSGNGKTGFYNVDEGHSFQNDSDKSAETAKFSVGAIGGVHSEERGITFKQIIMVE